MESTARLDYVLFQLTPTRTRCELVVFAGKSNEKLAYGLLDPFISHLRSAKDQIAKGGYSVTLRPPNSYAPWFTKATLQRFVRFVSTPEVLERFMTIEREIEQIDNSFQTYEAASEGNAAASDGNDKSSTSSKSRTDSNGGQDCTPEENSKARLQRILETRTAVRRKEQAMVYARALAAGFDVDNLEDLIYFSDAFGASRLRNACVSFIDLCKKKNEDRIWIDEVASMQAFAQTPLSYVGTSGIVLAGEDDPTQNLMINAPGGVSLSDSATSHGSGEVNQDNGIPNGKGQVPFPWANQLPQYMQNYQVPMYQQPPYPGFVYPGMQAPPPYYPGNMQWPPKTGFDRDADDNRSVRSSYRGKDRSSHARGSEIDRNGDTEPSGSSSESDSSRERPQRKNHGKKSSRRVVIRNINYISSRGDGEKSDTSDESSDEEDLDGDAIRKRVEQAVGSLEKSRHKRRNGTKNGSKNSARGSLDQNDDSVSLNNNDGKKGNEQWGAVQELLMLEESDSTDAKPRVLSAEEEYIIAGESETQHSSSFRHDAEKTKLQRPVSSDAFLVAEKGMDSHDSLGYSPNFEASENVRPMITGGSALQEFLFSQRNEGTETVSSLTLSDCGAAPSVMKTRDSDDWFINNQSYSAAHQDVGIGCSIVDGVYSQSPSYQMDSQSSDQVNKSRDVIFDDSIMIPTRPTDDLPDPQLSGNISMIADAVEASFMGSGFPEASQNNLNTASSCEPEDLYMVLDRGASVEEADPIWTVNMDFEADMTVNEASRKNVEGSVSNGKDTNGKKSGVSAKDARSRALSKTKPDLMSRNKSVPLGSRPPLHKSKNAQEEEARKRIEVLKLERQKRIAERSASNGRTPFTSKKAPSANRTVSSSLRSEKVQPTENEAKKVAKPVLRSSTIERLAAAKTTPKVSATQTKTPVPKKVASKANDGNCGTTVQKTSDVDNKKHNLSKTTSLEKISEPENINGDMKSITDIKDVKQVEDATPVLPVETVSRQTAVPSTVDDAEDIKELHMTSSISNGERTVVSQADTEDRKAFISTSLEEYSSKPGEDHLLITNYDEVSKTSQPIPEEVKSSDLDDKFTSVYTVNGVPESPIGGLAAPNFEEKVRINESKPLSPEISEIEDSTPPPTDEMSPDGILSRKKWNSSESSPKASKGLRKLLFGRKH